MTGAPPPLPVPPRRVDRACFNGLQLPAAATGGAAGGNRCQSMEVLTRGVGEVGGGRGRWWEEGGRRARGGTGPIHGGTGDILT